MNFQDVDINFLSYSLCSKNREIVSYNNKKSLEIFTPLVEIKIIKDSYDNQYIQLDLSEYSKFKELINIIDLHCMIHHNITEETRDKFKSSLFYDLLSCKIIKNQGRRITINNLPSTIYELQNGDKAKCVVYIDNVWTNSEIVSLKWKLKVCCVYRNDK